MFFGSALVIFLVALFLTSGAKTSIIESRNLLELGSETTTIILGDSHTECALDDEIIPNTENMSQSADCYLYSYVKLRELLRHNPQIDTVVLTYSYHNLAISQDEWLLDNNTLVSKLNRYYFLMNSGEIAHLLGINPRPLGGVMTTIFKTNIEALVEVLKGNFTLEYLNIGRYLYLDRNKLDESLKRLAEEPDKPDAYSDIQKEYLVKIRALCVEQDKTLMLMKTPIHRALRDKHDVLKDAYYQFYREHLGDITLLDYGQFAVPDSCYSDADHLNYKGARLFSNYIEENGYDGEDWMMKPVNRQ